MHDIEFNLQNIPEADGWAIALAGMVIVFSALLLISGFIAVLPRILQRLEGVLPPEKVPQAASPTKPPAAAKAEESDEAVVAAIGYALHLERTK